MSGGAIDPKLVAALSSAVSKGLEKSGAGVPFKFNVDVKRRRFAEKPDDITELDTRAVEYFITEHVQHDHDLYFIKLVAGKLRKRYTDLIVIQSREEEEAGGTIHVDYRKTDDVLSAWADAMETMKQFVSTRAKREAVYKSSDDFYRSIILKNEGLLVRFSAYTAHLISTSYKWMVQKSDTKYEIARYEGRESSLLVDLMREFERVTGHLREDMKETYFQGIEFDYE